MDLFADHTDNKITISDGAVLLSGFALPVADEIYQLLLAHFEQYQPQAMMTPMGYTMSVATTSMGGVGWVSSKAGYGYTNHDPSNHQAWPAIPQVMNELAERAADKAGYQHFVPDCCLVNVYKVGSKMGLHQDKDEQDFTQPVVSVSLGIPATFLMGGQKRNDKTVKILLTHGDVVVFGGAARRYFHGVNVVKPASHVLLGQQRVNLTFRKAR